jgi:hypothetical protein
LHDDIVVSEDGGGIGGYVRYRTDTEWVSVLELGVANNDQRTAAGLLTAAAAPRQGRLEARLPPSLRPLLAPWDAVELDAPGLMGRPLSLDALSRTLTRVWSPQLAFGRAGPAEVIVPFSVNDVVSEVKVTPQSVSQAQPSAEGDHLDAGQFTALLLRGCDSRTRQLLAGRADVGQLALIAPAHDFVLWPTDSF